MPMKFWRSSNSSKEDDGKALAEAGRALGLQSVVSLFCGREVAADSWRQIAERHHSLTTASGGKPLDAEGGGFGDPCPGYLLTEGGNCPKFCWPYSERR